MLWNPLCNLFWISLVLIVFLSHCSFPFAFPTQPLGLQGLCHRSVLLGPYSVWSPDPCRHSPCCGCQLHVSLPMDLFLLYVLEFSVVLPLFFAFVAPCLVESSLSFKYSFCWYFTTSRLWTEFFLLTLHSFSFCSQEKQKYTILLIITDGMINDLEATKVQICWLLFFKCCFLVLSLFL